MSLCECNNFLVSNLSLFVVALNCITLHCIILHCIVNVIIQPYDRNAVSVHTLDKEQIGHIQQSDAALMAPVLDRKRSNIHINAIAGVSSKYDMILHVSFFAKAPGKLSNFELQPLDDFVRLHLKYKFQSKRERLIVPKKELVATSRPCQTEHREHDDEGDRKPAGMVPSTSVAASTTASAASVAVSLESNKSSSPFVTTEIGTAPSVVVGANYYDLSTRAGIQINDPLVLVRETDNVSVWLVGCLALVSSPTCRRSIQTNDCSPLGQLSSSGYGRWLYHWAH